MALICGIDEAGRGPVIGPLVICGVLIDEKDEIKLKNIGVKDSKLLTPTKREDLFEKIKKIVKKYEILIVQPKDVDSFVESDHLNLNWLEANVSAGIINKLSPDKAILDCPSPNTRAYKEYVEKQLEKNIEVAAEHKADVNYPVVSAASILAKVTRDAEIEKIKKKIGVNFGSGYPSDEVTQDFLKKNWNKYPEIFRKSWSSYKNFSEAKKQKKIDEF